MKGKSKIHIKGQHFSFRNPTNIDSDKSSEYKTSGSS